MIEKFRDGAVPSAAPDPEIGRVAAGALGDYDRAMERFAFDDALKALWSLIGRANKFIDETAPWILAKEKDPKLDSVLRTLFEVLRVTALRIAPFMPDASRRMWTQLGLPGTPQETGFGADAFASEVSGVRVRKGEVLFPRIDLEVWKAEKAARDAAKAGPVLDYGAHEEEISIDDFRRLEFRVAKVLAAEPVPKADKLYKIDVDLGYEKRTIVSGIREFYSAQELVGRSIVVVCNLKPAKLRGVESRGMLLAAESPEGIPFALALLEPDKQIQPGSRIH
jgi:methionyl-tRNA synthetase